MITQIRLVCISIFLVTNSFDFYIDISKGSYFKTTTNDLQMSMHLTAFMLHSDYILDSKCCFALQKASGTQLPILSCQMDHITVGFI